MHAAQNDIHSPPTHGGGLDRPHRPTDRPTFSSVSMNVSRLSGWLAVGASTSRSGTRWLPLARKAVWIVTCPMVTPSV
eukprot:SAG22_NODE_1817_length_3516_cov_34.397425_4_plen_78_part_00